jgi:putative endonuclease
VRKKESATAIGRAGEEAAAVYLAGLGYRIRERNVRFRSGEIDLVAEQDRVLVFVEVKTRTGPGFGTAPEAVTPRKQQQLVRLAGVYLASRGIEDRSCRFDVVAVEPAPGGGWACTLITDAFCAS